MEGAILASWFRQDEIQHIHAHFGTNPAAIVMFASRFCGIPYSFTAHGSEEFEKAALLSLDEKLKYAAFAVCVSSFGRGQLMRWTPPDQWPKIAVIHCGLDTSFFDRSISPPPAIPRLVCVGRLDEHKAQIVLVGAIRRLHESGVKCEIVFAGDGPMRPEVEAAIRNAGLQHAITITGWISGDQVKAHIEGARALVLPSFSENMPVVIMEALALGRPVVSTFVAGIPELVQDGKTGWLVPTADETALTEALREVLDAPVERLAGMGAAGRIHVAEQHDSLIEGAKIKTLFEDHVGRSPARNRK
jgi:glycosyltransferase involved in cell wall biosynthesis